MEHLIGHLTALSHFLSSAWDKSIHFFAGVRKSMKFQWREERENAFKEVKCFLFAFHILVRPMENEPLIIYLVVSHKTMSSVLVQEGVDLGYRKIERLTLVVVITTRKLRYYFQEKLV